MTRRSPSRSSLKPQSRAEACLRVLGQTAITGALLMLATSAKASAQTTQTASAPLIVADFNHDGIPDVLVPSLTAPTATVSLGTVPYGTFGVTMAVTFPAACTTVTTSTILVGDFNGDGFPDLAFFCGDRAGTAGVMLGNGDGSFGAPKLISGIFATRGAVADFNQDGKQDIVAIGAIGSLTGAPGAQFLAGNGDGTFAAALSNSFANAPFYSSVTATDLNGDGFPDLVLGNFNSSAGPSVDVYGNNKSGTFGTVSNATANPSTSAKLGASGTVATSILTGSFFAAGSMDLAVPDTGSAPGFFLLRNTSTGSTYSLAAPVKTAVTGLVGGAAGAITDSGFTDLVAANGSTLTVLANDGTGTFTPTYSALTLASTATQFAIADANGDGYGDLYTATPQAGGALQLAVNSVSGTATATSQAFSLGIGSQAVSATWPGNVNFIGSTAKGTQQVNGVPSLASLSSSKNPSTVGDSITLTVAVTPGVTSPGIPSGAITLKDGTATLATGSLDGNGRFALTTSKLTQGTHGIQAFYGGDTYFAGSNSVLLSQVVQSASITPTLTWPTPASIVYGTPLSAAQLDAAATDPDGAVVPGTYVYTPAAGTILHAGTQTLKVSFLPTSSQFLPATGAVNIVVTQAAPVLTWAEPASIAYGIPLSATQLDATVAGIAGTLAGTAVYDPPAGTILTPGVHTLAVSFTPTDTVDYTTVAGSVPLTVSSPALASFTPSTATIGDANKTITLTGSGFVANSIVLVNGGAVATRLVNPVTLTAVIPAADFDSPGTLQVAVKDPSLPFTTLSLPFTVAAPSPAVTFGGPSSSQPGTQPSLTFTLQNPYPVELTATLTLGFDPSVSPAVDDPAIQFADGGRSFTFTVPANSTTVPTIQLQSGTVAGTITIPLVLTAGGNNVTPTGLQPVIIVIPPAIPTIATAKLVRNGDQLSVQIDGFSNTREVGEATFHFVGANGATINTPDITAPVTSLFATWYSSGVSDQYGSTFTYIQNFNLNDSSNNIGSVQVTLKNGVGTSTSTSVQ